MAIALSSSRCFDAVSNVSQAIKEGKASEAATILRSVKRDAELMQNELRKYEQKLQRAERQYKSKADNVLRSMNELYQQEQELRREASELKGWIEQLHSQNERDVESLDEANRSYRQACDEEQRTREKQEYYKGLMWIPIVNIIAIIADSIEQNGARAREARAAMERYQRHIDEVNDDIRTTNSRIWNNQAKITEVQEEARSLKQQRDSCHNELGAVKSIIVFILDASIVSREILNLTEEATLKSENLERIMRLAAKKHTLKVLNSGGVKTKVGSLKECFDEIAEMIQSDRFIYFDEEPIETHLLVKILLFASFILLVFNYLVLKVKSISI